MARITRTTFTLGLSCSLVLASGCADSVADEGSLTLSSLTETGISGDGDGDTAESNSNSNSGDGDGDTASGDGDGDSGDGDGDTNTGDGDGDTNTGDGDGDTGDGDGDTATGDGDGDTATGDGDGDTTGDGDGDTGTTGTSGNNNCQAPSEYTDCDGMPGNLTNNPFNAIGVNCGMDPSTTVIAANAMMNAQNNNS